MSYRVAVIGAGNPNQSDRYAMAYRHARGYQRIEDVELVACADIIRENAVRFANTFGINNIYEDYDTMLAAVEPDLVSVCTPTTTHAEIVIGCAQSDVDAVHCEKPMAATWSECGEMVRVCNQEDVQLTFNHQRRFASPYKKAKSMLNADEIGELQRIEIGGDNLYDYGSHLFDMAGYLTDQEPIRWVLGQVDCQDAEQLCGLYQESEALLRWRYESGVDGLASTGERGLVRCQLRLVGEDGTIEVGNERGPPLRVRSSDSGWETVDTGKDGIWRAHPHPVDKVLTQLPVGPDRLISRPSYVNRAVRDVVAALREGSESILSAKNSLQTTEIIFAGWESARRGGRVSLPLEIEDNPLEAMIENRTRAYAETEKPKSEIQTGDQ